LTERNRLALATIDDSENCRSSTAKLGAVPHGIRSIIPVTGGDFEGPRLRGEVLSGGGDWLLLRDDGVVELDLRVTLETDDHALDPHDVSRAAPWPARCHRRARPWRSDRSRALLFSNAPRFETSTERYAYLNRIITVGVGEVRPDGAIHTIDEIL